MNQSRNRKSNLLTTLALSAAGLTGLAGCESTNRREGPTQLETLLQRELGTNNTSQVANAARAKLGDSQAQALYRVLSQLGNSDEDRAVNTAIVGALETQMHERMTRFAAPAEATLVQAREFVAPYLNAQVAPAYEKNDGSEIIVNIPGAKSAKLGMVNGKFTTFALISDADLPATLAADYFRMQARLENGKKSLVYAAEGAPLASSINSYFTPNADVATLASDSLAARAMRTAANGKFGANDNLEGELLYARGSTDGTNTVYGLQTADGRTRVTSTDLANASPARVYALGEAKDLRVRVVYTATDERQEGAARNRTEGLLSPEDGPHGRQLTVRLEDVYRAAEACGSSLMIEAGVGSTLQMATAEQLVERLYRANPQQQYATGSGDIPALGIVFTNTDIMQNLLDNRKIVDKNGHAIEWLTMPGANYSDLRLGLQLYRRNQ